MLYRHLFPLLATVELLAVLWVCRVYARMNCDVIDHSVTLYVALTALLRAAEHLRSRLIR
jgi:hypothetical protein